jgi:hypothetical protein
METKTDKTLVQLYAKFRASGENAERALRATRILAKWNEMESEGLVRISAEPEQESYFDVFGEPEGYTDGFGRRVSADQAKKELIDILERDGCWYVKTEFLNGEEWEHADDIGMITGYKDPCSPFQNCYVPDLMSSAIEKAEMLEPEYSI